MQVCPTAKYLNHTFFRIFNIQKVTNNFSVHIILGVEKNLSMHVSRLLTFPKIMGIQIKFKSRGGGAKMLNT